MPTEATSDPQLIDAGICSRQRERLAQYLAGNGMDLGDTPIQRFSSGLANINYLVEVDGQPMVLRRPPGGELPPGAHDMAREFMILSRLWRAFPLAPRAHHLCTDLSVMAVPFQLITYVPGLVMKGDSDPRLVDAPDIAGQLGEHLVATLSSLHDVDTAAVGLGDLGRPAGFVDRAIEGWRRRAARITTAPAITRLAEELGDWLATQRVMQREPVLLHCDFKLDNMIFDPQSLEPRAVLDWDMGTRGDPLFDLATMLSYWTQPGDPEPRQRLAQMPTIMPGFPSRSAIVERYARARGMAVDDYPVFEVLAMFKLAVVFLQLHALYLSGATSDQRYAAFGALGSDLMQVAQELRAGT